jgi:hypothetical protein
MTMPAILSALLLAAPPTSRAGTARSRPTQLYFEQTTSQTVDGRDEGSSRVRVWCAGQRLRMEGPDVNVLILRLDQGRAYRLERGTKTAHVYPATGPALELAQADLPMDAETAVPKPQRLARDKVIAGHRCRGYRLSVGAAELEVYTAPDLPSGVEAFQAFLGWSGADQTLRSFLAALRQLPGLPLETRARVRSGASVRETLARISVVSLGPVQPGLFEPPAGYRRVEDESP